MRPLTGIAIVGLCMSAACGGSSSDGPEACSIPGAMRCKGNKLQWCKGERWCWFVGCVGPTWTTTDTCVAPKVCKSASIPGLPMFDTNGCYDANSSCSEEGVAMCDQSVGSPAAGLWTCSRRPSDQSLQWTLTACDQQSPPAICWDTGTWRPACYEPAGSCPPSFLGAHRCDGNVLYLCNGPEIVDGKAVFDWVWSGDCAATGMVCRNGACVAP